MPSSTTWISATRWLSIGCRCSRWRNGESSCGERDARAGADRADARQEELPRLRCLLERGGAGGGDGNEEPAGRLRVVGQRELCVGRALHGQRSAREVTVSAVSAGADARLRELERAAERRQG